ncbi:hypothetical protein GCM10010342_47750 [Streptomyces anulatus]|nr:hypothetical protein GCM10010342_47750 [Streptomyces anulatus]
MHSKPQARSGWADFLLTRGDVARTAAPEAPPAPPRAYRDERVTALLHDCANGALDADRTVEAIRALARRAPCAPHGRRAAGPQGQRANTWTPPDLPVCRDRSGRIPPSAP